MSGIGRAFRENHRREWALSWPPPYKARRMYVERTDEYEAGERVQGRLGKIVEQQDLGIERMLDMIFGPKPQATPPTKGN